MRFRAPVLDFFDSHLQSTVSITDAEMVDPNGKRGDYHVHLRSSLIDSFTLSTLAPVPYVYLGLDIQLPALGHMHPSSRTDTAR